MKKIIAVVFSLFFVLSCATVDVENTVAEFGAGSSGQITAADDYQIESLFDPVIQIIEKPVYVPAPEAPPARPQPGRPAVAESNSAGIVKPQDYSHAAMIYDYSPDFVYEIYAMPLRVVDITLQPGEQTQEPPFTSDSERWIIGGGISYENGVPVQHIYVKPACSGISASLVINTDMRVYRIILRSYSDIFMPLVKWRYPSSLPNYYYRPSLDNAGAPDTKISGIDPRFLSFNYRITYGLFQKPYWLPSLVFDDGSKTYVRFPDTVLQRELPAVFENRNDILNYRVSGNLIVIDKLIENITVRIGRSEITVAKKRRSDGS